MSKCHWCKKEGGLVREGETDICCDRCFSECDCVNCPGVPADEIMPLDLDNNRICKHCTPAWEAENGKRRWAKRQKVAQPKKKKTPVVLVVVVERGLTTQYVVPLSKLPGGTTDQLKDELNDAKADRPRWCCGKEVARSDSDSEDEEDCEDEEGLPPKVEGDIIDQFLVGVALRESKEEMMAVSYAAREDEVIVDVVTVYDGQ